MNTLKFNIKSKNTIAVVAIVALIIIILLILNIPTLNNQTIEDDPVNIISDEVDKFEEIISNINNSEIEITSNRYNEQSDIILSMLGIDIKNVDNYAIVTDVSNEGTYTIGILKPKEDYYNECNLKLIKYINDKQQTFIALSNDESLEIARNAVLLKVDKYIAIVMCEDSQNIQRTIKQELVNYIASMETEESLNTSNITTSTTEN